MDVGDGCERLDVRRLAVAPPVARLGRALGGRWRRRLEDRCGLVRGHVVSESRGFLLVSVEVPVFRSRESAQILANCTCTFSLVGGTTSWAELDDSFPSHQPTQQPSLSGPHVYASYEAACSGRCGSVWQRWGRVLLSALVSRRRTLVRRRRRSQPVRRLQLVWLGRPFVKHHHRPRSRSSTWSRYSGRSGQAWEGWRSSRRERSRASGRARR